MKSLLGPIFHFAITFEQGELLTYFLRKFSWLLEKLKFDHKIGCVGFTKALRLTWAEIQENSPSKDNCNFLSLMVMKPIDIDTVM